MGIIVQVLGSLLILIGFVFSQLGKLKTTSLNYYRKTMGICFT